MRKQVKEINRQRRRMLQAGGGMVVSGLVAACGGGGTDHPASTPVPAAAPTPGPAAAIAADISVSALAAPVILDSTFAGISVEKGNLSYPSMHGGNADLIGVFKRLGPGILRVGGSSADKCSWQPTGPDKTEWVTTRVSVDRLAQFARACDWKIIYGLNFLTNTPAGMSDEASYVASVLGSALIGFELCNEPDLYNSNALGAAVASYATFKPQWEQYANAIRAAVPSAVLTGPASSYNYKQYTLPFANDEKSRIALLTQHYYRNPNTASIEDMLTPDPGLVAMLQDLKGASTATLPYRMAETNSYFNIGLVSGVAGVSDAHASALWVINYLFTLAKYGCQGANVHAGGTATYAPIKFKKVDGAVLPPAPGYYGIYLFDQAAKGSLMQATVSSQGAKLFAHAVKAHDGSMAVVLVNTDGSASYQARVACAPGASTAQLTTLSGPSLASLSGTQINGATFGIDGSFSPQAPVELAVVNGQLAIAIAPGSAVLARIR